ncbi:MAG TPA: group II intron reverse transcriptase/maturase [Roseiarcus sp.]|nr:group II intron reverse transcriptase/maturase [Roseiarcus sp.]
MHEREKSGPAIGAGKPTNKAEASAHAEHGVSDAAEPAEQRAGAKGNASEQSTHRTQGRERVSQALERVRKAARLRKGEKLTALLHHINVDLLREAFFALKRDAAPGVDGVTWRAYEEDLDLKLTDLASRVHRGAYRALPSRRTYIPKADGRQRALAVAALEDKIVQRATVEVLNCIFEEDFLGFSYGFRPGRGQHNALDALCVGITSKKVNFVLDADIRSFFDEVSKEWVVRFVEHRVGDRRIIRLIQKWLKAGVLEDGVVTVSEKGTGQGSVISPLLSNVYLHYAFDLWAERWRRREATGDMIMVRYADDIIVGFQHESDARTFWNAMRDRLTEFSLSLHPEKTRLIEFGRFVAQNRKKRGAPKPETFKFLGFVLFCDKSRRGDFRVGRKSRGDRMQATLREIKDELRRRINKSVPETGKWLASVVSGYFAYHAVPTNGSALAAFRYHVTRLWHRQLCRRSQRGYVVWARMTKLANDYLPQPRILHPWPSVRFAARHPR